MDEQNGDETYSSQEQAYHVSQFQTLELRDNGTICVPQIVAASLGGLILKIFTTEGSIAPEVNMLVLAGVFLIIGAACVGVIKEGK